MYLSACIIFITFTVLSPGVSWQVQFCQLRTDQLDWRLACYIYHRTELGETDWNFTDWPTSHSVMFPPCWPYRRCEPGDGLETTDRCQPCNYGWYSQSHLTGPACPSLLSGSPHYFCCDTSLSPLLIIIPPPPTSPPALRGTNTTTSFRRRPGTDTGKLCIRGSGKVLKQNAFIHLFMACIQQLKHGLWYEK